MKTRLLLILTTIIFSLNANAQAPLGFEEYIVNTPVVDEAHSDIDGDGDLDLFMIFGKDTFSISQKLVWLENTDGQGHYGEPNIIKENTSYSFLNAADINGDGNTDVVAAPRFLTNNISWFQNLGQGTFGTEQVIGVDDSRGIYTKDMDGDGDVDIVNKRNPTIEWFENLNGQGGFAAKQSLVSSTTSIDNLRIVDMDGDTDFDLLLVNDNNGKLAWYENLGQVSFSGSVKQTIDNLSNSFYTSISTADLDVDGDMDVMASKQDSSAVWYENTGGAFVGSQTLITSNNTVYGVWPLDFDADGDMDIVSSEDIGGYLYENTGQLNFGAPQLVTKGNDDNGFTVDFTDLEGDGDKDLLWQGIANWSGGQIFWNENLNGQGSFSDDRLLYASTPFSLFDLGDIDGDGDLDMFPGVMAYSDRMIWYENQWAGTLCSKKFNPSRD